MTETADLKLQHYRAGDAPTVENNRLWPLFGAGWENLGVDGGPIDTPMPAPGPDELLVRHDAVGICFSDVKVLRAGNKHPRTATTSQAPRAIPSPKEICLLYTSPSPRDRTRSRMPSSA